MPMGDMPREFPSSSSSNPAFSCDRALCVPRRNAKLGLIGPRSPLSSDAVLLELGEKQLRMESAERLRSCHPNRSVTEASQGMGGAGDIMEELECLEKRVKERGGSARDGSCGRVRISLSLQGDGP